MHSDSSVDREALHMAGTMLRFVRLIDRGFRGQSSADLTLTDLSVLVQIERGVDLPSILASRLHLDRPRVTRISDHLVELGLVERRTDVEDRRRCRLSLSDAGRTHVAESLKQVSETMDGILSHLSKEDRSALLAGISAIRPIVDREDVTSALVNAGAAPGRSQ